MKPAPFEDVHFVDAITGYEVRSVQPRRTEVLDPAGNRLWSARKFTGRHRLDLSPDGQYLVTSGGYYFTTQLSVNSDDELATIYRDGVPVGRVRFSDVFSKPAEQLADELGLAIKGGGWADRAAFVRLAVDWGTRMLLLKLCTGEIKTFELERERYQPSDPTEAALFDQLRARPLDQEIRGVYADWLEQHGFVMPAKVLRAQTGALRDLLGT